VAARRQFLDKSLAATKDNIIMDDWQKLIGLKIVAIKKYKNNNSDIPDYIFFSDGETFISLDTQDYISYHDCSRSAREILVYQNKQVYNNCMLYN